jgi:hypothetical protein
MLRFEDQIVFLEIVFLISSLSIKNNNTQESAVAKSNTFQAPSSCVPLQLVDIFHDLTIKQYFHEQYLYKRIEHQEENTRKRCRQKY